MIKRSHSDLFRRFQAFVIDQKCIPWRVSNRYQKWMERTVCYRWPVVYRLLRFGCLTDRVRAVTRGPKHHFFGYYEKSPWNRSGHRILAHEVPFNDRPPNKDDSVQVGVVHLDDGDRFEPLAETHSWNWQQGAMLQWHPVEDEDRFFFNVRQNNTFRGVLHHVREGRLAEFERPIYAVSSDGRTAFSLNFSRLHRWRPGYGYAGVQDPFSGQKAPSGDGLFTMDLVSDDSRLLVSLADLAQMTPIAGMADSAHWLNHVQVSPGGKRVAFFHIWRTSDTGWSVRLYSVNPNGSELIRVLDTGSISHYDWMDDDTLLVWARHPDGRERFLLCGVPDGSVGVFGEDVLNEDGHCSFSPDRRWILNDTYPDEYDRRAIMVIRYSDGKRFDLERFYSPKDKWWGEIRCDLHPRWGRDGTMVCVDSVHSGERQIYLVDLSDIMLRESIGY